ncbi:MmgE/PrpD family protein [Amycolatopsis acidicola]|uniref:MmgE/PrpD family protein n=1 Tax=Amycolatopsis acidicola TaxID=2596893 RepID=UPI0014089CD9|nr:MmgE/PrpD family protein [Amycolatopsis acidicola]
MDQLLGSLVDFVCEVDHKTLGSGAVSRAVRHTLDTIGCGAGGFHSRPVEIARGMATGVSGPVQASLYGSPNRVLVDVAAFANISANRNLDFNDFGLSGHPSDMIGGLFAMAEASCATGADLVCAVYLAYEIATALAEASPLSESGWDQGLYCSLGAAAGMAKLRGLDREQVANALALAIVPSVPLRATRSGELSEWKGSATAHAIMTASFAVRLAERGMTGPAEPFEGKDGLFERALPPFQVELGGEGPSGIERATLKRYPACYWGQTGIDAMLALRPRVDVAQVERIDVATCHSSWWVTAGGCGDADAKWHPRTRESADHSLPYMLAAALVDGKVTDDSFSDERRADPALAAVVGRVRVVEDAELTARSDRDRCPTDVTLVLADGRQVNEVCDVPRGHPANPMTDVEVREKFDGLVCRALPPERGAELGDRLSALDEAESLEPIARLLRAFDKR